MACKKERWQNTMNLLWKESKKKKKSIFVCRYKLAPTGFSTVDWSSSLTLLWTLKLRVPYVRTRAWITQHDRTISWTVRETERKHREKVAPSHFNVFGQRRSVFPASVAAWWQTEKHVWRLTVTGVRGSLYLIKAKKKKNWFIHFIFF